MCYKQGKVYRIVCLSNPEVQYIGSTFNTLRNRWQIHKRQFETKRVSLSIHPFFEKYGIDDFKLLLIKEYEVCAENNKDRKHLDAYEQLWINKTKCVNTSSSFVIPAIQKHRHKKYCKEYYKKNKDKIKKYAQDNKESIREYQKEYRKANREKARQYSMEYREANKEKLQKYQQEYRQTNKEKLKQYRQNNKSKGYQYQRKYREANKDKVRKYHREYYKTNKEWIREYQREYYKKKKETQENV